MRPRRVKNENLQSIRVLDNEVETRGQDYDKFKKFSLWLLLRMIRLVLPALEVGWLFEPTEELCRCI